MQDSDAPMPADHSGLIESMPGGECRFCGAALTQQFVDLGMSPLCETFLTQSELNTMEPFYPLRVWVCGGCFLVQLQEYVSPEEIFREYAYFSSYSQAWLKHASDYTDAMQERFSLDAKSLVVELASNDGYLLQYFVAKGIPVLGIEPAVNVARDAEERGVRTRTEFFGADYAAELVTEGFRADLIVANNVLAQVPDLNSFVEGIGTLLAPEGVATIEFPHLLQLMQQNQFDTIYHEHFSYFSLHTTQKIFAAHGMRVFDVDELWSHGGSLRVFACREDATHVRTDAVGELVAREDAAELSLLDGYTQFEEQVRETKRSLLEFLITQKRAGSRIVGYGAPGKGNTLLNYCGIREDLVEFTVDRNPYKHGRFLPGTHIPIHSPEALDEARPDLVLILPWNLREEISEQLSHIRSWGGRFVVPIPKVEVF